MASVETFDFVKVIIWPQKMPGSAPGILKLEGIVQSSTHVGTN